MPSPKAQLAIGGLEDRAEEADELDAEALLREELWGALRAIARELTYEVCAAELDKRWGPKGRPVSASLLRAALNDTERNNFRLEWVFWFAKKSELIAELVLEIGGRGRARKKPENELRDLKELMRRELGSVANKLIRKAEVL